ncbi:MAG: hypothetical protein IKA55_03765, partial [Akkermansia sp.]|nr:hypothetical protein [Akkermansia sp.]
ESFDQNTDDINESSFETPLELAGIPMLAANGKQELTGRSGFGYYFHFTPGLPSSPCGPHRDRYALGS